MRFDVCSGREPGKACCNQSRHCFQQSSCLRAERAVRRFSLAKRVKPKSGPAGLSIERFFWPGEKTIGSQRDHFISDDMPIAFKIGSERILRGIFKHKNERKAERGGGSSLA